MNAHEIVDAIMVSSNDKTLFTIPLSVWEIL